MGLREGTCTPSLEGLQEPGAVLEVKAKRVKGMSQTGSIPRGQMGKAENQVYFWY